MYKSPIEIIQGELQTKMDGAIMKAVQKVGINVDKDELLHALAYDRGQYQLGFRDGKAKAIDELVRCKDCMHTEIDKYAPAECQNRCKLSQQYHEPTFFCKCGEPRTDLLEWIHRGDDDEQGV